MTTKFLETITIYGNDALVPINRIKCVNFIAAEDGYAIKVIGDDGEWIERFSVNEAKEGRSRYEMIKEILRAE